MNTEPANATVYTINNCNASLDIWSGATGKYLGKFALPSSATAIAINQSSKKAYVTMRNGFVQVMDLQSKQSARATLTSSASGKAAINENTNTIYVPVNSVAGGVIVIDGATDRQTATIATFDQVDDIAVNPANNRMYLAIANSSEIEVIDTLTNTQVDTAIVSGYPRKVAVNPNTNQIYVIGMNVNSSGVADAGLLTTLDPITNSVANAQPFPSSGTNGNLIAMNPVDNQVVISDRENAYHAFLFDHDGNMLQNTNLLNSGPPYESMTDSVTNPTTGNTYTAGEDSGVWIYDRNGRLLQTIAAACVSGIALAQL